MKKLFTSVLALLMIVSLAGCAKKSEEIYKAGTYSVEAKGNNGTVNVDVTFTADKIKDITVTSHEETPGLGDVALEEVAKANIEKQSTDVD